MLILLLELLMNRVLHSASNGVQLIKYGILGVFRIFFATVRASTTQATVTVSFNSYFSVVIFLGSSLRTFS